MSERGDVIDQANAKAATQLAAQESEIRYQAQHMPVGQPGYCCRCCTYSARLVVSTRAPCRDFYRLT